MLYEIKDRYTGSVLFSLECDSLNLAVEAAVKGKANLRGANLRGANLHGANLHGANLDGAYLRGAKSIWQSHDLIAEVLLRAAGEDIEKRKLAGLVLISRDWCWTKFLQHDDPLKPWAIEVLREFGKDDEMMLAELKLEAQEAK